VQRRRPVLKIQERQSDNTHTALAISASRGLG
jgi:hypothetical protein